MNILTTHAIEESTFVVTLVFTDEDDEAATPKTMYWTLSDTVGSTINSREGVLLTPASTVNVTLSGDDLQIVDSACSHEDRLITVYGTYDSDLGSDLPFKSETRFTVLNGGSNTHTTIITTKANEQGAYVFSVSFTDEDDDPVTPDSVTWTLTQTDGTVVNSREDEVVTPATTVNILLQGDDLQIIDSTCSFEERLFKLTTQYDGSYGDDLPFKTTIGFVVENLKVVT